MQHNPRVSSMVTKRRPVARKYTLAKQKQRAGLILALPWIIGISIFSIIPILASLYFSFTNYSILEPGNFVGIKNYLQLMNDATFKKSIVVTLYYTALSVPLSVILGVFVSILLNVEVRGQAIFRTIAFLPSLVPVVAIMVVWNWLLNPQLGIVNWFLGQLGISGPAWLADPNWAMPTLIMIGLWGKVAGSTVIYLAGLQDIPVELYEAANVDGAGVFRKAWHITLPLLTPVIFFQIIMGIIDAMQQFNLPYLLTGGLGGPKNSLMFFGMYQYNTAFAYLKMGYASAQAWVMFIIIAIITLLVFRSQSKWVFYQGNRKS